MDAMSTVTDLVCKYMICLRDSSKLEQCMECILSGLDDGSVKVNLQSLQCLHKIHMEIPALLPSMQLSVLPALLKAASSGNKSVSSGAQPVLKNILSSCGVQHVVTHLCHMSLYEAGRLRIVALRVLADHIPRVCGSGNPATNNAVKMTIFPTIKTILLFLLSAVTAQLLAAPQPDQLSRTVVVSTGDNFLRWVVPSLRATCKKVMIKLYFN